MITKLRSIGSLVFAAVAGLAVVLLPASASAASYTPEGLCGSGYYIQRSHALPQAKVYQLYNGSANCVVTLKNAGSASYGKATRITAGLKVGNGSWSYDTGDYKYYAGPVIKEAKGKCVSYFGYHKDVSFESKPGNCG